MAEAKPAKDLKPTGARARFLIEGKQRQLRKSAQEMRKKAKAQAKDKQPRPAKDIQKGSAREKIWKDSRAGKIKAKPPVVTGSYASSLVRTGAARLIGAVGAIVDPSFMSYKTGGAAGSPEESSTVRRDRSYGPLMKANSGGGPRSRQGSQAPSVKRAIGGGPERRQGSSSPSMGVKRSDSYFGDISSYGGTQKAKVVQKGGGSAKKKAKPTSASSSAAAPRKAREMTFQEAVRRNVTEEYMKKKMRPKKSLLGSLRKKGNN